MKNCSVLRMFRSCLFCCSKNDNQCQSKSESPMLLHWSSTPGKEEIHADYNLQFGDPYTYMPTARVPKTNAKFFSMFHSCLFCCPKNDNQCRRSKLNPPLLLLHWSSTPGKAALQFMHAANLANTCNLQSAIW